MKYIEFIRNALAAVAILVILTAAMCLIFQYEPAVVMSGSMEPVFHTGSVVLVDRKHNENMQVGDTIAFKVGGAYVTHRIIERRENGYITKGDANSSADPWLISDKEVKGKVVLSIPKLGYFLKFMAGIPGIIIISCLILCMGLLSLIDYGEEA